MNKESFLKRVTELDPHIKWNEVAGRANISENTVSKYVNGRGNMLDTMEKIIDTANAIFRAKRSVINAVPVN